MKWNEEWVKSVGRRVSVVVDPCAIIEGVVTKIYPSVPRMCVQDENGREHYTHPRYVWLVW